MNVYAALKAERKMSFAHWRYRLLHWTFGIDPKTPSDSVLPSFLYTHYCPLFHLTNLLLLLMPLIWAFHVWCTCVIWAASSIHAYVKRRKEFQEAEKTRPKSEDELEIIRLVEVKRIFKYLSSLKNLAGATFENYWEESSPNFQALTEEEALITWKEFVEKINEAREKARLKRKRLNEMFSTVIAFSQFFFKGLLNLGILALGLIAALLAFEICRGIWLAVMSVDDWWGYIRFAGFISGLAMASIVAAIGLVALGFWVREQSQLLAKEDKEYEPAQKPVFVVRLACDFSKSVGRRMAKFFGGIGEFVAMFYEDNCPPVKIVSEIDEGLADIEEDNGDDPI